MRTEFWIAALVVSAAAACKCHSVHPVADGGTPDSGQDGGSSDGGGVLSDGGVCALSGCVQTGGGNGFATADGGVDGGVVGTGDGVVVDPSGNVTLGGVTVFGRYAWIADHPRGYVSKYDTHNTRPDGGLIEVARYYSGIPYLPDGGTHYADGGPLYVRATYPGVYGNCPSRTVSDLNGDMWVANRAPDIGIGSITKVATNNSTDPAASGCIDRNHDGIIETSLDRNGNGIIDESLSCLPWQMNDAGVLPDGGLCEWFTPGNSADAGDYDECVLFSTEVGSWDSTVYGSPNGWTGDIKGRGLAVSSTFEGSGAGEIWLIHHHDQGVYAFNGDTGYPIPLDPDGGNFVPVGIGGYGAIADSRGTLWVVADPGVNPITLAAVDTSAGQLIGRYKAPWNSNAYAMGLDGQERIWVADWQTGVTRAVRYTPSMGDAGWTMFDFTGLKSQIGTDAGRIRGIAVDNQGWTWGAMDAYPTGGAAAQVIAFDSNDGGLRGFPMLDGGTAPVLDVTGGKGSQWDYLGLGSALSTSIGVAIDTDNNVWVNNYGGVVMRVSRDGGVNFGPVELGNYYSYSDFTGYELNNYTAPRGSFTVNFQGCPDYATWENLSWTDNLIDPTKTSISVTVRVSDTLNFSASTPYTWQARNGSNSVNLQQAPGPVPQGTYMQVTFVLTSLDHQTKPVLESVSYTATCNPPGPN